MMATGLTIYLFKLFWIANVAVVSGVGKIESGG
jgi:hypothetical protein